MYINFRKKTRINIERLKDCEVRKHYEETINKEIRNISINDVDIEWEMIRGIIAKTTEYCVGALKKMYNS